MSLWHADKDTRKEQIKKAIIKKEADSFRELEDIFDEFDSSTGKAAPKEKINQVETEEEYIKPPELPSFSYDEIPDLEIQEVQVEEKDGLKFPNETIDLRKPTMDEMEPEENEIKKDSRDRAEEEIEENEDEFPIDDYEEDEESFLPVNSDSPIDSEEEEKLEEEQFEDPLASLLGGPEDYSEDKEEVNSEHDGKYKEIDEEKLKDFFSNMFSRFKGKDPSQSTGKEKKSKKKLGFLKFLIPSVIIVSFLIVGYLLLTKGYSPISEVKLEEEKSKVTISNLSPSNKSLSMDIKNGDSISKSGYFIVMLEEKSSNPFKPVEITCESDIIDIMTGQTSKQTFTCSSTLSNDGKYKIVSFQEENL